jgi:hypothetical protein
MLANARKISMQMAQKYMMLKPEDWAYTPGKLFNER